MARKSTALAVAENFQLVNRYADIDPELLEELQDEMEDLDQDGGIDCRKIKIPSGGSLAYIVQGEEDGDEEYMKEVKGVVLFTHKCHGYWPGAFGDGANKAPVCSSMDGKAGMNTETGAVENCDTCPYNQYGTAIDPKTGRPAKGKACKNMRRLYLMMDGDPNVYLLTVPPTSVKDVNLQMKKILASGVPYTGLIVRLTLEKAANSGGTEYGKVKIEKAGLLPPQLAEQAKELRRQIKEQYKNTALTFGDYIADDTGGGPRPAGRPVDISADDFNDGYQEAPPHGDEDLPFA